MFSAHPTKLYFVDDAMSMPSLQPQWQVWILELPKRCRLQNQSGNQYGINLHQLKLHDMLKKKKNMADFVVMLVCASQFSFSLIKLIRYESVPNKCTSGDEEFYRPGRPCSTSYFIKTSGHILLKQLLLLLLAVMWIQYCFNWLCIIATTQYVVYL